MFCFLRKWLAPMFCWFPHVAFVWVGVGPPASRQGLATHSVSPPLGSRKTPTQRRPRPVDPVGAEVLRLEKRPRARSGRGTNLFSIPTPSRPPRFTLASPGGPNPRSNHDPLRLDWSYGLEKNRPSAALRSQSLVEAGRRSHRETEYFRGHSTFG
jgi:hypothetical protein